MILGLDHAQITIPKNSEAQAKEFYCGFLGLQEIEKPENRKASGGFWLVAGDFQVHVGVEDGFDRTLTKAHVAYRVDNIETWKTKFTHANIEIIIAKPLPSAVAFEFRDPFGNRGEIIQQFDK